VEPPHPGNESLSMSLVRKVTTFFSLGRME
jgi:hypothetical protein